MTDSKETLTIRGCLCGIHGNCKSGALDGCKLCTKALVHFYEDMFDGGAWNRRAPAVLSPEVLAALECVENESCDKINHMNECAKVLAAEVRRLSK